MSKVDEKKQNRIILQNSAFSVGFKALSYLLAFLTTPLLLQSLGETNYGIYTTTLSLVSWIYYFDFGIGSGLRNRVTESLVKGENEAARKSVSAAYVIISEISLAVFAIVFLLSLFLDFDKVLNAGLHGENLNVILVLAILLACINFVMSISKNLLWAVQKTALVDGLAIVSKAVWLAALWMYSRTGSSSMLVIMLLEGLAELLKNGIAIGYVAGKYPMLTPHFEKPDRECSKGILSFGLQIFVMQISALVLNATDNMIIMKLFSAADVTPYNMAHKFFSVFNVFFIAAIGPLWTAYTTAYTMKDAGYIRKTLRKSLMFCGLTLAGIVAGYFVFIPFMGIYLGKELEYQGGLILLVAVYYAIWIFSHSFSSLVHGISKVKLTTIACVISTIVNIPCSIYFAVTCGMKLNGVILGSIVSIMITTPCYIYTAVKEIRKLEREKVIEETERAEV